MIRPVLLLSNRCSTLETKLGKKVSVYERLVDTSWSVTRSCFPMLSILLQGRDFYNVSLQFYLYYRFINVIT